MINKMAFARYIKDKQINTKQKIMVEIGSTRSISEQDSTFHLATFCNENDIHFITVDVDKNNIEMAKMGSRNTLPPQIKANLPNVNTSAEEMLLKENANRYTWEGRLANMSILKKVDRNVIDKNYSLSFADFKKLQKQNK